MDSPAAHRFWNGLEIFRMFSIFSPVLNILNTLNMIPPLLK